MNTPPLLIGAVLLFWGWQTGLLAAALPMALVLEASRLVRWRMSLQERDFSRVWKVCAAVFLAVIVLVYITTRANVLRALQWSPVMFFPIVAAQSLSTSPGIDSRVFFLWIRTKPFNLGYPFVLLALGAACAAKERAAWLFPCLAAAVGWTLWSARPARSSRLLWAMLFVSASALGFVGAVYLRELQKKVEDLYIGSFQHEVDTSSVKTAIGDIGKRKQSNLIVFRAKDLDGSRQPLHLSRASYNVYRSSSWYATSAPMTPAVNSGDGWKIGTGEPFPGVLEVSTPLKAGEGFLVAPVDAVAISGLRAQTLSVNRMGAVKVEGGPGLATYRVLRSRGPSFIGPPDESDLSVPKDEAAAVSAIAAELGLARRKAPAVLDAVKQLFNDRFVYALDLKTGNENGTPLADFLLRTHAGHCEYFATAATLLLRKAGVPARYTVGYLAHEFSPREDAFIVRSRDAHAWVLAYVDGAWRSFDPTPPSWVAEEQMSAGMLGPVRDLWSYLSFRFSRWRWREGRSGAAEYGRYWLVAALPALLFLAWKSRKRFHRDGTAPAMKQSPSPRPGQDSPFFEIERLLAGTEWERRPGETYAAWLTRIDGRQGLKTKVLAGALAIHNRYRFDPAGISGPERRTLEEDVEAWLKEAREAIERSKPR